MRIWLAQPKHYIYIGILLCFALGGFRECLGAEHGDRGKTLIVEWNEVLLEGVRHAYMGPPMVARALAVAHTCMYEAWAAYDSTAIGTQLSDQLRRPAIERTAANKAIAISYAAYRAARELFPDAKPDLDRFMISLGYDPLNSTRDTSTAIGIGNTACDSVLAVRHNDGSNQMGEMNAGGRPYSDYTGYTPINEVGQSSHDLSRLKDPNRFQPTYYPDASVRSFYPQFVGAHWFKVLSFAGPYTDQFAQVLSHYPLMQYGSAGYESQAWELVRISAALTDEQKMIVEYWTDGPRSELPPGHWCLFAQFVSIRDHHSLEDDIKMFFVLTNALMDAGIAAWEGKRTTDSVRPLTAIHYLLKGKMIRAWGGPGKGPASMDGADWIPYQPAYLPTPPFPEYPSGHSTFSAAGAKILQLWTHSDDFGEKINFSPGSSKIEPGITPATSVNILWPTFTAAANQAGMSRRYGGIHFKTGDLAGRELGRLVADKVWSRAQNYFEPHSTDPDRWLKK